MKVPLEIGLIIACAAVLPAILLLIARGIIRKRRARRLTREEKKLLEYAYKSQGVIHHIESDRIPGGWIRAGGVGFQRRPRTRGPLPRGLEAPDHPGPCGTQSRQPLSPYALGLEACGKATRFMKERNEVLQYDMLTDDGKRGK